MLGMLGMLGTCVASMLAIAINNVWAGLPVYWQTMSVASFLALQSCTGAQKNKL